MLGQQIRQESPAPTQETTRDTATTEQNTSPEPTDDMQSTDHRDDYSKPNKKRKANPARIYDVRRPHWPADAVRSRQETEVLLERKLKDLGKQRSQKHEEIEKREEKRNRIEFAQAVLKGGDKKGWPAKAALKNQFPQHFTDHGWKKGSEWMVMEPEAFLLPTSWFRALDKDTAVLLPGESAGLFAAGYNPDQDRDDSMDPEEDWVKSDDTSRDDFQPHHPNPSYHQTTDLFRKNPPSAGVNMFQVVDQLASASTAGLAMAEYLKNIVHQITTEQLNFSCLLTALQDFDKLIQPALAFRPDLAASYSKIVIRVNRMKQVFDKLKEDQKEYQQKEAEQKKEISDLKEELQKWIDHSRKQKKKYEAEKEAQAQQAAKHVMEDDQQATRQITQESQQHVEPANAPVKEPQVIDQQETTS